MGSVLLPQLGSSHSNQSASQTLFNFPLDSHRNGSNFSESSQGAQYFHGPSTALRSGHSFTHGQQIFDDRAAHPLSPSTSSHHSAIYPAASVYAPRAPYRQANLQSIPEQNHSADGAQSSIGSEQEIWDGVQAQRGPGSSYRLTSMLREKKTRRKLITLITSTIFLTLVLALYFAFTVSRSHMGHELHILLIFMVLILTIVFCHSLIRFSMVILQGSGSVVAMNRIPSRAGHTGYAQLEHPIHVTLVGDEEILAESNGASREKVAVPPPAYGLWRSSVRINPDLLYWQRVKDNASSVPQHPNRAQGSGSKALLPRPPSYTSDNGIDYVIEAQPRLIIQGPSSEQLGRR
ncbi:hypothetical protein BBP40_012350 [Aspergillus hancockii]|nr:hypothetical protein BBP40_012350 [Aspergillus hancockii]